MSRFQLPVESINAASSIKHTNVNGCEAAKDNPNGSHLSHLDAAMADGHGAVVFVDGDVDAVAEHGRIVEPGTRGNAQHVTHRSRQWRHTPKQARLTASQCGKGGTRKAHNAVRSLQVN